MNRISVPRALTVSGRFNAYTEEGAARKDAMHSKGKTFLKAIAKELGLGTKDYAVRSNLGGIAVSGEVTLHADNLYVQLHESMFGPGLSMMFRGCRSRKDYQGLQNNSVTIEQFNSDNQEHYVQRMKGAMETAKMLNGA